MLLHRPDGSPIWINPHLVHYAEPAVRYGDERAEGQALHTEGTDLYFHKGPEQPGDVDLNEDRVFVSESFDEVVAALKAALGTSRPSHQSGLGRPARQRAQEAGG